MTARTDGSVHDDRPAPACFACHDDIPQSPRSLIDGENWMCDDRPGCLQRQDLQEAAKNRALSACVCGALGEAGHYHTSACPAFDPNARPLIIPPGAEDGA